MTRPWLRSSSSSLQREFLQGSSMAMGGIGFPESSQRTTVTTDYPEPPEAEEIEEQDEELDDIQEAMSETMSAPSPSPEIDSLSFPRRTSPISDPDTSFRRVSRSSMMRLENILNDVSIEDIYELRPRSRSLGRSPAPEDTPLDDTSIGVFSSSSLPESPQFERSVSPTLAPTELSPVRKKKVKMHRCPQCHKDFPRPSGLRTHMNIHTKEKPFGCSYPGCRRTFSVVSNAKRHMRTHGLGIPVDEAADEAAVPYVVGFEAPMVVEPQPVEVTRREQIPLRLKWIQGSEASSSLTSSTPVGKKGSASDSEFGPRIFSGGGNSVGGTRALEHKSMGMEGSSPLDANEG